MINKLEISSINAEVSDDIKKYVRRKIGKLDSYMPRHARKSAHAEIKLKDTTIKAKKQCTVDVTIFLPGDTINAKETTVNMYAAVDIVEEKLKTQIRRYKSISSNSRGSHRERVRQYLGKIVRKNRPL